MLADRVAGADDGVGRVLEAAVDGFEELEELGEADVAALAPRRVRPDVVERAGRAADLEAGQERAAARRGQRLVGAVGALGRVAPCSFGSCASFTKYVFYSRSSEPETLNPRSLSENRVQPQCVSKANHIGLWS